MSDGCLYFTITVGLQAIHIHKIINIYILYIILPVLCILYVCTLYRNESDQLTFWKQFDPNHVHHRVTLP